MFRFILGVGWVAPRQWVCISMVPSLLRTASVPSEALVPFQCMPEHVGESAPVQWHRDLEHVGGKLLAQ